MVGRPYSDISFGAKNKCSELLGIDPHFDPKTHKTELDKKVVGVRTTKNIFQQQWLGDESAETRVWWNRIPIS